ncbi:MAG: DegT/DnrJ/EryC1/StrS family aminotransferase, partial [Chloroflexota bacterium]|nr:DegT/DnrJ/EryC1/StrS family aminotransferase [Chloroflexota bacterium]
MSNYRIPRSLVHLTHQDMRSDIMSRFEHVLLSEYSVGAHVAGEYLEQEFIKYIGHKYATGVHSATMGMLIGLRACGVMRGDEVITVGNSDISTTAAIHNVGATSVLCDIKMDDYTIDPEKVEALITKRTKAILPVDMYGHPSDVKVLRAIADKHNLAIVQDAALALGATDHGLAIGSFADVAVFSFAPLKPMGSLGNGGMVATSSPEIHRSIYLLTGYGHSGVFEDLELGHQDHIDEGYNVPIDPFQASLVSTKLPRLSEWTERRREIVSMYVDQLSGPGLHIPTFRPNSEPTFRCFTICVQDRGRILSTLRDNGVEAVLHYVPPVYRQSVYKDTMLANSELPVTDKVTDSLLC